MLYLFFVSGLLAVCAAMPQAASLHQREHKGTTYSCADEDMEFPGGSEWFKDSSGSESQNSLKQAFLVHYQSIRDSTVVDGNGNYVPLAYICYPQLTYLPEGVGIEHHGKWSTEKKGPSGQTLTAAANGGNPIQVACSNDNDLALSFQPDVTHLDKALKIKNGNGCKKGSAHGLEETFGQGWEITYNDKQKVTKNTIGQAIRCSGRDHGVSCLFGQKGGDNPWDV
ncbi:hypothetical protein F5B20DRAFT_96161 [Whalleya microplaca]|nr:hypothetical protein F5B20DRAFT_96161 [Whalleya microplaca]